MKILASLRRALAGVAALVTLAASAVAQAPRVQMGLITDFDGSSSSGVVRRIDLRTGKYLGAFGAGSLFSPSAIAVDPVDKTAVVADYTGLRRFDVSTGRLLGLLQRNTAYGAPLTALRFGPDGALYAVASPGGSYRLLRLNPATGAVVASGDSFSTNSPSRFSVGIRANGHPEVFAQLGIYQYSYEFQLIGNHFYVAGIQALTGADYDDIRVAGDGFLRLTSTDLRVGVGNFGMGDFVTSASGVDFGDFAEGRDNQTFLLARAKDQSFQIVSFDTLGIPLLQGLRYLPSFPHGPISDFAIYEK